MQKQRRYGLVVGLAIMLVGGMPGLAYAVESSSTNYKVTETQFGAGGSLQDCSTNYCAKTSVGDTATGGTSSTNYSAQAGFNTSDVPLLEVTVLGGAQNLGVLDVDITATATSTIKVRNYLSNGYVLQLTGQPPAAGTHTLTALTVPSTSHQGAEQFGINLAANTSPAIGANPVQVPSGSFSFGTVTEDYATPDLFKYVEGDVVAQSLSSSGETDYTMSMILNVSNVTPGGRYTGSFSVVAVPIF